MKHLLILSGCILTLTQCTSHNESPDLSKVKEDVINTDIAFSKMSADSGYQKAFIAYADENMIKLNPRQFEDRTTKKFETFFIMGFLKFIE